MGARLGQGASWRLALLALAAAGVLTTGSGATSPGLPGLLKAFLSESHVTRTPAPVLLLMCAETRLIRPNGPHWTLGAAVATTRELAVAGFPTQAVLAEWLLAVRTMDNSAHTVVLDTACPGARTLLRNADEHDMFRGPRRWVLLVADGHPSAEDTPCHYQLETKTPESLHDCHCHTALHLEGLRVFYDSDVSALCLDTTTGTAVSLSAYRVGRGAGLRLQRAAGWRAVDGGGVDLVADPSPDRRPVAARRLDFQREACNIGFLVTEPDILQKEITNGSGLNVDYFATFGWSLSHAMAAMLNMTVNVTMTPDWGRTPANVSPDKGLMGLHAHQQIEFGGVGWSPIIEPHRLRHLHFTNFYCPAAGIMVFRAPPLSYENNVFTLPFPMSLWEASVGIVGLCVLLLIVVMHAERVMMHRDEANNALHSGSDAILLAIAAVCQQGSPVETRGVPSRTIALLLFLLVLLLYTCYSASIVVFMQRTSTSIRHFRDLPHSRIKVGSVNLPYLWHYMKTDQDPTRQRVYQKKLLGKHGKQNMYPLSEGVQKVRDEYFCFLAIQNQIFAQISSKWQEHEKCGLVTIGHDFLRVKDPHFTITRGSYRVDAFRIMLRRLAERGIWHRMMRRYVRQKPSCGSTAAVFHSVSLTDCRGAFYMFITMMAVSVVVFLLELAVHRRKLRAQKTGGKVGDGSRAARDARRWTTTARVGRSVPKRSTTQRGCTYQ